MTGFSYDRHYYEKGIVECKLTELTLIQGQYSADFWFGDNSTDLDAIEGFVNFSVEEADVYGTGKTPFHQLGVIYLKPEWRIV
jgi:hypothetical protein